MYEEIVNELNRLHKGPMEGEEPEGVLHTFRVKCHEPANVVAGRVREVMDIMLRADLENWPANEKWSQLLPQWFVGKCAPEQTRSEVEVRRVAWRARTEEEQKKRFQLEVDTDWSLRAWVYLFDPDNERPWYWWNLSLIDGIFFNVIVGSEECMFASQGLRWFLRVCGGIRVTEGE